MGDNSSDVSGSTPGPPPPQADPKHRVTNACEACRAAKVRCQASKQLGICRRCLDSKRECVFKTGPRTRRPRQSKLNPTAERPPPPPGPSKTFTIDVPLAPEEDTPTDSMEELLRDSHDAFIERLLPSADPTPTPHSPPPFLEPPLPPLSSRSSVSSSSLPLRGIRGRGGTSNNTPPGLSSLSSSSTTSSASMLGLRRPQFNLDSAASLLDTFRDGMAPYFPVAGVRGDATVPELARERPFVLLAVLAAASGARLAMQGHHGSLYDEEFRKILGLKFVAGGERSVELLVGLLVYCAWYPVHLRPRTKQSAQYIRMAVDIVRDLELEDDDGLGGEHSNEERLEGMRAYLGCYYLVVARAVTWSNTPSIQFSPWTAKCCEVLAADGAAPGDRVLAWMVRHQHMVEEITALTRAEDKGHRSTYQTAAMLRGLEAQFREWKMQMPPDVAQTRVIIISTLTVEAFLYASHLWKPSAIKGPNTHKPDPRQDPARMYLAVPVLRMFLEYMVSLPATEFSNFTNVDWGRFIFIIILCFRMSFTLASCPGWDDARARRELDLGRYLDEVCREDNGDGGREDDDDNNNKGCSSSSSGGEQTTTTTDGERRSSSGTPGSSSDPAAAQQQQQQRKTGSMNVVSASKIVFGVVKQKFDKRVALLAQQQQALAESGHASTTAESAEPAPPAPRPAAMSSLFSMFSGFTGSSGSGAAPPTVSSTATPQPPENYLAAGPMHLDKTMRGCPMLDGSLEGYFPMWDEGFRDPIPAAGHHQQVLASQQHVPMTTTAGIDAAAGGGAGGGGGFDGTPYSNGNNISSAGSGAGLNGSLDGAPAAAGPPLVFHDLWATMTMGWTQDEVNEMELWSGSSPGDPSTSRPPLQG